MVIFTIILMFLKLTKGNNQSPLCDRLRELRYQFLGAAKSNAGAITGWETAARPAAQFSPPPSPRPDLLLSLLFTVFWFT